MGEVEHILPWEAIGVGEVDHILPWGRELKWMGSTIYSHGEGAVVAEVEFLVYTHVGMELKWMRFSIYPHGQGADVEHILTGGGSGRA